MKKILFLTNSYPYCPGEEFIESEIEHWSICEEFEMTIFPSLILENIRNYPESIRVDKGCSQKKINKFKFFYYVIFMFFRRRFFDEIVYLWKNKKISIRHVIIAAKEFSLVLSAEKELKKAMKRNEGIEYIYSYWSDSRSYAAVELKLAGKVKAVYCRAHRFDLYEEYKRLNYMPLKRQYINHYDKLFAISDSSKLYMEEKYFAGNVSVSRLGVSIPAIKSRVSPDGCLTLVSVSYCVPVKRIEKIIESVEIFATKNPALNISWFHIGGGELLSKLKDEAEKKLSKVGVKYNFVGQIENNKVKEFYERNSIDVFINVSESEGVPVSIMEAMSYGIPVIATDVGGVCELVSNDCGYLLPADCSSLEIESAIGVLYGICKSDCIRSKAVSIIKDKYSAETNYKQFISCVNQ